MTDAKEAYRGLNHLEPSVSTKYALKENTEDSAAKEYKPAMSRKHQCLPHFWAQVAVHHAGRYSS